MSLKTVTQALAENEAHNLRSVLDDNDAGNEDVRDAALGALAALEAIAKLLR